VKGFLTALLIALIIASSIVFILYTMVHHIVDSDLGQQVSEQIEIRKQEREKERQRQKENALAQVRLQHIDDSLAQIAVRKDKKSDEAFDALIDSMARVKHSKKEKSSAYSVEDDIMSAKKLKAVDLGLSVLWADRNLGASEPNGKGIFYQWGGKRYEGLPYVLVNKSEICGTVYDVARCTLGKGWRMPTDYEMWELTHKCSWRRMKIGIQDGYCVRSMKHLKNRKDENAPVPVIFIPLSGRMENGTYVDGNGYYWTGTRNCAIAEFSSVQLTSSLRQGKDVQIDLGYNIRPVRDR